MFVAAQLLRTATARSHMKQIDGHLAPWMMATTRLSRRGIRLDQLPESTRQRHLAAAAAVLAEHNSPNEIRLSQLRTILREIDRTCDRLGSWHWKVICAPRPRLITGDAPAVTIPPARRGYFGLIPDGSPVYLPLSPTQLLVGAGDEAFDTEQVSSDLAQVVNQQIADQASDTWVKATFQGWPRKVRFGRTSPLILAPTITVDGSARDVQFGPSPSPIAAAATTTFPASYPPVSSASIRDLLTHLGAADTVQ